MKNEIDTKKRKEDREALRGLEKEAKMAFLDRNQTLLLILDTKIKALDPSSDLIQKLIKKLDSEKEVAILKERMKKIREYKVMLKSIFKQHDAKKLISLAEEFRVFAPEDKIAAKWVKKSERLDKKLSQKAFDKAVISKFGAEEGRGGALSVFRKSLPKFSWLKKVFDKKELPSNQDGSHKVEPIPQSSPVKEVLSEAPKASMNNAFTKIFSKKDVEKSLVNEEKKPADGNIFTKMFSKKEGLDSKVSIIDAIVAKTEKKDDSRTSVESDKKKKENDGTGLLFFSKIFLNFTAVFIVFSGAFLYVEWIDQQNVMLGLIGISQNTGGTLHAAASELSDLKKKEIILNKNIELYKEGYYDKTLTTVDSIINERINWPNIFAKINEVTNSVYELNDFFKYIQYNNYSFDADNNTIRVTGTLSDPLGRNLTKLVELEEAFKSYPRKVGDSNDATKPYFSNFKDLTSFSKTLDPATGRYVSSFQLAFALGE